MRYFKLENANKETFDLTTEEFLFHDISGLGFEEDNDFRRVGPLWRLESSVYRQKNITGKMCFTDRGQSTPYEKYWQFISFINTDPLYLCYWPYGLAGKEYRKRVRVSCLEKSEINKYGAIDERIEFSPYTAWFERIFAENSIEESDGQAQWIWDQGALWRDSFDDPLPPGGELVRYKFGNETKNYVAFDVDAGTTGLVKLTIHGPAVNPLWNHYVDGILKTTGGMNNSPGLTLSESETLVIDNTTSFYTMTVINTATGVHRNVYSLRDFDKKCFIELSGGANTISVVSGDGEPLKIEMEGRLYYATV